MADLYVHVGPAQRAGDGCRCMRSAVLADRQRLVRRAVSSMAYGGGHPREGGGNGVRCEMCPRWPSAASFALLLTPLGQLQALCCVRDKSYDRAAMLAVVEQGRRLAVQVAATGAREHGFC